MIVQTLGRYDIVGVIGAKGRYIAEPVNGEWHILRRQTHVVTGVWHPALPRA